MKNQNIIFFLLLLMLPGLSLAQSFVCNGDFYLSMTRQDSTTLFYTVEIDSVSGIVEFIQFPSDTINLQINAIGYRVTDNYIYGIDQNGDNLVRINNNGNALILGKIDGLDEDLFYWAGAITPDGKTMIAIGSRGTPIISEKIAYIDLTNPTYPATHKILSFANPDKARLTDISFDPITGNLYGYDNHRNKLTTIDIATGFVDNNTFPTSTVAQEMGALYFDAFGNIYGYGIKFGESVARTLFKINKETGEVEVLATGPGSQEKDGCSCPYTIRMTKRANPELSISCNTVEYIFVIANSSGAIQNGILFEDIMPPQLTVRKVIRNPFGGDVSGIGTSSISISNMVVPVGVDSIVLEVFVDETAIGFYENQALLANLPAALGETTVSDNPLTLPFFDSTTLEVIPVPLEFSNSDLELCEGDSTQLDAYIGGADYLWNTGENEPVITVTNDGTYWVIISSECETITDTIVVHHPSQAPNIDLGEDIYIDLGDEVFLNPSIFPFTGLRYSWTSDQAFEVGCNSCENMVLQPTENMSLKLYAIDEFGCNDADVINIIVNKVYNTYIPSAFSPNQDGLNDRFYIYGKPGSKIKSFRVYNRWGATIYEIKNVNVNDYTVGWDGTYKGQLANSGVYLYVATIEYLDGKTEMFTGDITLFR